MDCSSKHQQHKRTKAGVATDREAGGVSLTQRVREESKRRPMRGAQGGGGETAACPD